MSTITTKAARGCFLPLSFSSHKGSSGRIGVLGGSARYTGAPYYAAMSALQVGADLAYVFCAQEAADPIKCYSPELMVAPVYRASEFDALVDQSETETTKATSERKQELMNQMIKQVVDMMDRMHVLVIGPGLGRCPIVLEATAQIIRHAMDRNLYLVIDADGLFLLTLEQYRDLIKDYDRIVLTPNVVEYKRLIQVRNMDNQSKDGGEANKHVLPCRGIIVKKGQKDEIQYTIASSETLNLECLQEGGMKRSGGLGDILAGAIGTFVAWNQIIPTNDKNNSDNAQKTSPSTGEALALSCWTACSVVKRATKLAFDKKRRAMTAPDVLEQVGTAVCEIESEIQQQQQ